MPSGRAMRSATNASSSFPDTTSTMRPSTWTDMLYSHTRPGWCASGIFDSLVIISAKLCPRSATLASTYAFVDEIVPVLAVDQTRGVPQQILHDHRPALWLEGQGPFAADDVGLLDSNLHILELGQVLRDRRQQIELALLYEHHGRH